MAVLTRTTQTALYCHRGDPAVTADAPAGPDPDWVPATGQPADATRFEVRPLSPAELSGADDANGYLVGLVSIDGQPPDVAALAAGWTVQIANLITAITHSPFHGLLLRSREKQSAQATAGG